MNFSAQSSARGKKKGLDFELNLIPAIDLLSVCICFLLLTAVWVHLGSLKIDQGIGETNAQGGKNPPSLWVEVSRSGELTLSTRDLPQGSEKGLQGSVVRGKNGRVDQERFDMALDFVQKRMPQIGTVIVRPNEKVPYGLVISVIDRLKAKKIKDVGIAAKG